jgi:hypothetical protein
MPRSALGLPAALLIAACAPTITGRSPGAAPPAAAPAVAASRARVFQGVPDDAFWVSREPGLDRVIIGASRLELSPEGEASAAAWDAELSARGEGLLGALALPDRLGGGFVHWSRNKVFRSAQFTGALVPVASAEGAVRGARLGLRGALVITDAGLHELLPGAKALTPLDEPATQDLVVLDEARALRLDVFGRASATDDGGKRWSDLSPLAGLAVRGIGVGEQGLLLETWQGRFKVEPGSALSPAEPNRRGNPDPLRSFEAPRAPPRGAARDDWPWEVRDATPLQAAVFSGARLADGSGIGVVQSMVSRVDLATGKLVSLATDWIPSGLSCDALAEGEASLLACVWERYQGFGGYLLRAEGSAPPAVERAFTDDGGFVADDEGALGYTGSCRVTPRVFDPEEAGRGEPGREAELKPVLCVRKAGAPGEPAAWIERRVDLGPGESMLAWIPRRDGSAVALVFADDPLPEPARSAPRVRDQGGVRVVRVHRELPGWSWARPSFQPSMRGMSGNLDRRFHARDDGTIDGWLGASQDSYASLVIGVTLGPDGRPAIHDLPPALGAMVVTGDHGVAVSPDGALHETRDHGRSWLPAGRSPLPPASITGGGCSALGCVLGPLVRLGWGEGALTPQINLEPLPVPESRSGAPRLVCAPSGAPVPQRVSPPGLPGSRQTVPTGYGDTVEILRDLSLAEPSAAAPGAPGLFPGAMPLVAAPAPSAAPPATKPGKASAPILRTHTLIFRPPFEPSAPLRHLNATDAALVLQRRSVATPLLAPGGEVGLLVAGESSEILMHGDRLVSLPGFESRRAYYGDATGAGGLILAGDHALLLGESRRRPTLEEHGAAPPLPPLFLGAERDSSRKRVITLGRRDDGALGILVFDGPSPRTVGLSALDRRAGTLLPARRLAPWSSLITADDPRCAADPEAYQALVLLDPSTWLDLDPAALPGVALTKQGMALVRWGKERVCLLGLDVGATEGKRRGDTSRSFSLVARWSTKEKGARASAEKAGAALRAPDLSQALRCTLQPPTR